MFKQLLIIIIIVSAPVFAAEKIKGISFVGSSEPIDSLDVQPIVDVNANWVTLMPYGFIGGDQRIKYNSKWQWWGEKDIGVIETIKLCRARGLKIMLKPQIWIMNGYTGDFKCSNNDQWEVFEKSYRDFILHFAKLAHLHRVDLFCIGTEWRDFIQARSTFWNKLVNEVDSEYEGALTYAANWDDYQKVPFWSALDYIGVNGYFPVSLSKNPAVSEIRKGWTIHSEALRKSAKEHNKKIIFTEVGYRSMEGSTISPWEHNTRKKASLDIQSRAYRAMFDVVWEKDWFAGMFIWKWFHNHKEQGGKGTVGYTPQNKPAQEVIQKFWASHE